MTIRTGSYSAAAAELTDRFGLERALDRRRVAMWHQRRSRNADGQMFPSPVKIDDRAKPRQARVLFDLDEIARWAAAGVPAPAGDGWVPLSDYGVPAAGSCMRLGCGHAARNHIGRSGSCLICETCPEFVAPE